MRLQVQSVLRICFMVFVTGLFTSVLALPSDVTITPPAGSRFLVGQKFDLRVEGKGTAPFSATLFIDGRQLSFTSGIQNSSVTDGITIAGWGGFNLRGYTNDRPGRHTLRATFIDATGAVTITSEFEIIDPRRVLLPRYFSNISDESHHPERNSATAERETLRDDSVRNSVERRSEDRSLAEGALPTSTKNLPIPENGIKNIIIMIGDGMGISHRTAARIVRHGVTAGRPNGMLAMDLFPGTGFVSTHSLNSIVTDSAPGMSCYVTGNHQNNNQEGVFPAHVTNAFFGPRLEYLSEYLHRTLGKSLGIVSTADVEDATPAANAIHTANRGAGTGICDQYLDESDSSNTGNFGSGLTVLLGGGRRWFLPAGQVGSSRGASTDYPALPADLVKAWNLPVPGASDPSRDLIQDFKNAGFTYADTGSALNSLRTGNVPDKLLGLFAYTNMNVALDKLAKRRGVLLPGTTSFAVDDYRAPDQPMLDEMTDAALKVLSKNKEGFVLMVEAAHIDKQSHSMDAERAVLDTIEFDNAVAVARNFADVNGDTLVLVTADHECSGFTLIGALTGTIRTLQDLPSDSSTNDPATQPERQKVIGVYESAGFPKYTIAADGYPATLDVDGKLLIGFGGSADRYETWLQKAQPVYAIDNPPAEIRDDLRAKGYPPDWVSRDNQKGFFLRGQAGGRTAAVHTASDVPISAYSSGRKAWLLFTGVQENTDVFFKIARSIWGNYEAEEAREK
jgi:alkaline phosphatase